MSRGWSFAGVWNKALDTDKQRELVERDYVWASELGRGYYDRYWKMHARKPTTPPGPRAQRKFEAGNLTEWVMAQVLARAGVLRESQTHLEDIQETYGANGGESIKVTGRLDFMAGGDIANPEDVDLVGLPDSFQDMTTLAIERLREMYPTGLKEQGIEIKSCAGMMFDQYLRAPLTHHALQAFFYAKTTGKPFILVYVSRDDLRICEWLILPESEAWQLKYDLDLKHMNMVYHLTPQEVREKFKEPLLNFNDETEKFSKNFEVEYSSYLTDYGFDRPDQYKDKAASPARRLNLIVKKIREGKDITGKVNVKSLEECYAFYPDAEPIIKSLEAKYEQVD